jgi:hypothetical protein
MDASSVADLEKIQRKLSIQWQSKFEGTTTNYINMFPAKKVFNKVKKHYILLFLFFSHMVTVSTQTFIPSFYKFKHYFILLFLSKGCEVLHNCFWKCVSRTLTLRSSLIRPLTTTQFSSMYEALGLPLCFSGSSFSVVQASLKMLHHRDPSFQLKTFSA